MSPSLKANSWKLALILTLVISFSGCVGVVVDVARDVSDAAFDVTEAAVSVPVDVARSAADIPSDVVDGLAYIPHNLKYIHSEETQWSFPVEKVSLINAETANGFIKITPADGKEIKIVAKKEIRARTQSKADFFAGQVTVRGEIQGNTLRLCKDYPVPSKDVMVCIHYEIQTPPEMSLNLETKNGWIDIDTIHGAIHSRTTNGRIQLTKCSGSMEAYTTNGPITLQDSTGPVIAKTTNGGIHLVNYTGMAKTETSNSHIQAEFITMTGDSEFLTTNGGIDIKIHQGLGSIHARTENGSIALFLPPGFAGQLEAQTSNAGIHTNIPVTSTRFSEKHLSGSIGGGGDAKVDLKSTNGGITIDRY